MTLTHPDVLEKYDDNTAAIVKANIHAQEALEALQKALGHINRIPTGYDHLETRSRPHGGHLTNAANKVADVKADLEHVAHEARLAASEVGL